MDSKWTKPTEIHVVDDLHLQLGREFEIDDICIWIFEFSILNCISVCVKTLIVIDSWKTVWEEGGRDGERETDWGRAWWCQTLNDQKHMEFKKRIDLREEKLSFYRFCISLEHYYNRHEANYMEKYYPGLSLLTWLVVAYMSQQVKKIIIKKKTCWAPVPQIVTALLSCMFPVKFK